MSKSIGIPAEKTIEIRGERFRLSLDEAAILTGISRSLLFRLANEGRLPGCRRLPGSRRFLLHFPTFEGWVKSGSGEDLNASGQPGL